MNEFEEAGYSYFKVGTIPESILAQVYKACLHRADRKGLLKYSSVRCLRPKERIGCPGSESEVCRSFISAEYHVNKKVSIKKLK